MTCRRCVGRCSGAIGAMLEQEHLRFINMFAASGDCGSSAGKLKYPKGIMEHKVIQNLKAVN